MQNRDSRFAATVAVGCLLDACRGSTLGDAGVVEANWIRGRRGICRCGTPGRELSVACGDPVTYAWIGFDRLRYARARSTPSQRMV